MDRVTDFESGGCAFEPRRGRHATDQAPLGLLPLLLARLEKISADSIWAHRASGVRGSLMRMVEQMEDGQQVDGPNMKRLISYGFQILESAAREKTLLSVTSKKESLSTLVSANWIE